jgi:glycine oxidase
LYCADDHQVDNRAVLRALIAACRAAGVALFEQTPVDGLVEQQEIVRGVRCRDTVHRADQVVVAAGPWSGDFAMPVRPLKGQSLALRMDPTRPVVRHVVWGPNLYMAPKSDGRLILGATMEEVGFNEDMTAGGVLSLLEAAWRLVPSVEHLAIDESWVGFRPGSRDDAPLMGPAGPKGVVVATGHHRNGILLAPVTAALIACYVKDGTHDPALERFAANRFEGIADHNMKESVS